MKIAILGTGLMGTALAEAMINAGNETIVFNRTALKTEPLVTLGAKAAATASEAIMAADASIIVLTDGASVEKLLSDEATRAALQGKKLLNASTINPDEIIKLAGDVSKYGGELAEMSIMVGSDELCNKQGQFLIGCKADEESFWKEILHCAGNSIHRVGEVGAASKAETPMLLGSMFTSVSVAYAAAMAIKLNIPHEIIAQQIALLSSGAEYLLPNMFARNYDQIMASTNNFIAVSTTAINSAKSLGMPTEILESIRGLYANAAQIGYGEKDGSSIVEVLLGSKHETVK